MSMVGHDAAWQSWRSAMAGARMHHAWLLAGKKGLGKATFAQAAARELLGAAGEGDHPASENVPGGGCTPIRYTFGVHVWPFRGCPPPSGTLFWGVPRGTPPYDTLFVGGS